MEAKEYVYEFCYSRCIHESAAQTMSIHKTRKGAEMAMEHHKEEARKEWIEDNKKDPDLYDVFGKNEGWFVEKTELKS